ncbi:N-6 DNA methylase [Cyanobacterium aponinum FACHB-4101]|uniref:type ISP restriction/modification enzyme n=1 Tax=Cyanobacterium aponinum TaxID=379064 RepID=UPI001681160A|nr:type ISP restriction/modification enzyme [Cyanobacterium aponinum]MBD2395131.1 N-6 DNA methylase [Cyanobacterium aponinum FACHB-4101]
MSKTLIHQYRRDLESRKRYGGSRNESSIRYAFATLLNGYCKPKDFLLVEELSINSRFNKPIRLDGIVKDALRLDWGYWEAKDEKDSLDAEIEAKFNKGYPNDNILFEDSQTAVLIQNGNESLRINMEDDDALDTLLNQFLDYERAEVKDFRQAISNFSQDLPIIIDTLRKLIDSQDTSPPQPPSPKSEGEVISTASNSNSPLPVGERLGVRANQNFINARDKFLKICQESINPDITIDDVREMIIQHILTEDIFTNIFSDAQFHQENNIARQLNEVIKTFFTGSVKKNTFKTIQSYYNAIIRTASSIVNHQEKQKFLKVVYENFYKAYNPKEADRLGIVYTPNEIVKFMVQSTDYLLEKHFHKTLGDKGVEILDPCTGTGTFITEILDYLLTRDIEYKYQKEIHCNEMSILPYYIANLNIEYTYQQKTGEYLEFNNICLVDTLNPTDTGEKQMDLFSMNEENTDRIKRQNRKKISVIIGNPPYNAKQENFNDNNANRKYETIDKRIKNSYIKEGTAQNQIVVYDMYTRFIRWATDRLNDEGIIAFITNSSLIDARAFDGFRKCLENEFDYIYLIDLGGNIRANPKLSGTTHNVFGIQTGVTISFLIKSNKEVESPCKIYYSRRPEFETNTEKLDFISKHLLENIDFETIKPDKKRNWINQTDNDFDDLISLIDKDVKAGKTKAVKNEETGELENKICEEAIFQSFSRGVATQRDEWVYDINKNNLEEKVKFLINTYQATLKDSKYQDQYKIKWDADLISYLNRGIEKEFNSQQIFKSNYRPFYSQYLYFDKHFNGRTYQWFNIYNQDDLNNKYIALLTLGATKPFHCLGSNTLIDLHFTGDSQCLPLYRYENGERIENITDWALNKFREYYNVEQPSRLLSGVNTDVINRQDACFTGEGEVNNIIKKEDIFYYVYGVLHNPKYREKYELNLKREFPRIPFYDDFWQWASWGEKLMDLHLNYETIKPYKLKRIDLPSPLTSLQQIEGNTLSPSSSPIDEGKIKVKLKADKVNHKIIIDEVTILEQIPPLAWEYKLGNRSALEWILDQYKERKPRDKTIAEKFNNYRFADYKEQVIDLLMRVTTVSVETMNIINQMNNSGELKSN